MILGKEARRLTHNHAALDFPLKLMFQLLLLDSKTLKAGHVKYVIKTESLRTATAAGASVAGCGRR